MTLDTLTCDMTTERLLTYLAAPADNPALGEHLATCPTCCGKLARLASEVLAPVAYRPPDLSFLRGPAVPDWFGTIVRRGVWWAQDQAQRVFVDLGAFSRPPTLQPALVRSRAPHVIPQTTDEEYEFTLGAEELDGLELNVIVHRHPDRPETARVVVRVTVRGRLEGGFAGSQVEMKTGELTRSARTDDTGLAVFEEVSLGEVQEATFTVIPA